MSDTTTAALLWIWLATILSFGIPALVHYAIPDDNRTRKIAALIFVGTLLAPITIPTLILYGIYLLGRGLVRIFVTAFSKP